MVDQKFEEFKKEAKAFNFKYLSQKFLAENPEVVELLTKLIKKREIFEIFLSDKEKEQMIKNYLFNAILFLYDNKVLFGFVDVFPSYKASIRMTVLDEKAFEKLKTGIRECKAFLELFMKKFELKQLWAYTFDKRIVKLAKLVGFRNVATIPKNGFLKEGLADCYILLKDNL